MSDQYQGIMPCGNQAINGNSIDITFNSCDSEVKADIVVSEFQSIRLWGQIRTCDGRPVANALLKLIKEVRGQSGCEYIGIAHTISDCKGFYQFDLCAEEAGCSFKIIVSKASTGSERVINPSSDNCHPCSNPYTPCRSEQCPGQCNCPACTGQYSNSNSNSNCGCAPAPLPCNCAQQQPSPCNCPECAAMTQCQQCDNSCDCGCGCGCGCGCDDCRSCNQSCDNLCRANTYECRPQACCQ